MPKDGYNAECETRAAAILRQECPDAVVALWLVDESRVFGGDLPADLVKTALARMHATIDTDRFIPARLLEEVTFDCCGLGGLEIEVYCLPTRVVSHCAR